ncbi:hypothetical protein OGAPHI_005088 [Ogataea philodendri]|uniref:Uncharacterized protein n=1 Tax=Ogataea philodendri TaxID=1378263 RepID=A0A9P8P2N2_9ASCO|nr:uncharacterized protein OGAPHI_005088 [Ogataea philodendri]KAH3663687.1 hypothetical protein OGAPHI_005088 [Ogataea philodendri]
MTEKEVTTIELEDATDEELLALMAKIAETLEQRKESHRESAAKSTKTDEGCHRCQRKRKHHSRSSRGLPWVFDARYKPFEDFDSFGPYGFPPPPPHHAPPRHFGHGGPGGFGGPPPPPHPHGWSHHPHHHRYFGATPGFEHEFPRARGFGRHREWRGRSGRRGDFPGSPGPMPHFWAEAWSEDKSDSGSETEA